MSARKVASEADWRIVWETLVHLQALNEDAATKVLHKHLDAGEAFAFLEAQAEVWLVDGYLVCFRFAPPWFSSTDFLQELLIVRVGDGGTLTGVADFLRSQARAAGAAGVILGTALAPSDPALSRLYQAEGFSPQATMLIQEL